MENEPIIPNMEESTAPQEEVVSETPTTETVENPQTEKSETCTTEKKSCCKCTGILNIVLLIGLVVLYVLHFTGIGASFGPKDKVNPEAKAAFEGENGTLKIAYINTDTLMAKYQYAKDLEKQLQDFQAAKQKSLANQMQQLQKDYDAYIHGGADNMTLTQQQAKEKELQDRATRLQSLEGEYAQQIQEKTLAESEKMTNAVYNFIREYNAQNQQFDIILARSFSSSPILYGNEDMDITDEIVEKLNEEYATVKQSK